MKIETSFQIARIFFLNNINFRIKTHFKKFPFKVNKEIYKRSFHIITLDLRYVHDLTEVKNVKYFAQFLLFEMEV